MFQLSVRASQALAQREGGVWLLNVAELSAEVADALTQHVGGVQYLHTSTASDPMAIKGLGNETCVRLSAESLRNRAAQLSDGQGTYAEAEPLFRQWLAIEEMALGSDHPGEAEGTDSLAFLCWSQAKYADAEQLYDVLPVS